MLGEDLIAEIEKLKSKKIEITNKINLIDNFEEKEDMRRSLELIENQIEILRKMGVSDNG